jgi:hypothetical protein
MPQLSLTPSLKWTTVSPWQAAEEGYEGVGEAHELLSACYKHGRGGLPVDQGRVDCV